MVARVTRYANLTTRNGLHIGAYPLVLGMGRVRAEGGGTAKCNMRSREWIRVAIALLRRPESRPFHSPDASDLPPQVRSGGIRWAGEWTRGRIPKRRVRVPIFGGRGLLRNSAFIATWLRDRNRILGFTDAQQSHGSTGGSVLRPIILFKNHFAFAEF